MDAIQFGALIEKTIREACRAGLSREVVVAGLAAAESKSTALRMTPQDVENARAQASHDAVQASQAVQEYLTDYLEDCEPVAEGVTLSKIERQSADAIIQGLLADDEFRGKVCRWYECLVRLDNLQSGQ